MEKKQSSVEWLQTAIYDKLHMNSSKTYEYIINKAKAMQQKEITDAYVYGAAFQIDIKNGLSPIFYYNDRFGDEKEVL